MTNWLVSLDDVERNVPESGRPYRYPIRHGSMRIGVYAPRGRDPQQPHAQDELYIVIRGTGSFVKGEERRPFRPGDAIFVEAGIPHRFEDFSDDFETWVIFYGPEGGEGRAE